MRRKILLQSLPVCGSLRGISCIRSMGVTPISFFFSWHGKGGILCMNRLIFIRSVNMLYLPVSYTLQMAPVLCGVWQMGCHVDNMVDDKVPC